MNRLIPLLALATLTACRTDRRPPALASGPVIMQGFDAAGNPTSTSYAGRTAAAAGQINDTSEAEIVKALADKIERGTPFAYAHIVKADVVQPNVDLESKTDTAHKAALQDAAKAMAAGAAGDYAKAAQAAASLGAELIQIRAAKANAPKPDSGANSTRLLAVGPDSGLTAVASVATYGKATEAKQRASYGATTDTKTTDTTTPADIDAFTAQMREARLAWEARNKVPAVAPVAPVPPITQIPVPFPGPVSTNLPPFVVGGTNETETIQLPVVTP